MVMYFICGENSDIWLLHAIGLNSALSQQLREHLTYNFDGAAEKTELDGADEKNRRADAREDSAAATLRPEVGVAAKIEDGGCDREDPDAPAAVGACGSKGGLSLPIISGGFPISSAATSAFSVGQ